MSKLLIKNGLIFDPINSIAGEVNDILIENGKIVNKFSNEKNVKEINAKDKTIIPSALDIHAHIASHQLNLVRLLGARDLKFQKHWAGLKLLDITKNYIMQGFSFILEANVMPSFAKQTTFDFLRIPVLDKGFLLNISNLWALELEYQKGLYQDGAMFVSDLLRKVKGFGVKIYNPFEAENWNWNILRKELTEKGRLYNFHPLDVYITVTKIVEFLKLPHSVHAHIEGYESREVKENLMKVLNEIKPLNPIEASSNNLKVGRSQIFHLAHASSYNIDGDNSELIDFFNKNLKFDLDIGFVGFNPINPIMTSDRRFFNSFKNLNEKRPVVRESLESEGDSFIGVREFNKRNVDHCNLWGNALDLALNIKNKWQVQFSVNFPIYSDIKNTPLIYEWLMNKNSRERFMKDMNTEFLKKHPIVNNSDEYSFKDLIIITRSSPAKSLGLEKYKGNLGLGADGDLNVLDINIDTLDPSKQVEEIIKAFQNIEYVIKEGNIVKKQDDFALNYPGKIFWSKGNANIEKSATILNKKREFYEKYSSIFYDSFETNIKKEFLREI